MTFKAIAAAFVVALVLAACGPTYRVIHDYTPPPTAEGRYCVAQCQSIQNQCRSSCTAEEKSCRDRARLEAQIEFERYVARQKENNEPVKRSVSWFERPNACFSLGSCSSACDEDFRVCYGTCGGKVLSTTVCTSGCEQ